ncbi:MAG: hypothetical protein ACOCT9_03185 [archaeon]
MVLVPFNASMTGMVGVLNLDPSNTVLYNNYNDIVSKYMDIKVPERVIKREMLNGMNCNCSVNMILKIMETLDKC